MITGLWGKKIGMTQVFEKNAVVPVTVVDISSWVVTAIKTEKRDGYNAIQVGNVKKKYIDTIFSKQWLKKPRTYFATLKEIKAEGEIPEDIALGSVVDFNEMKVGAKVNVFGTAKGLGFAGVVRRYNFGGPPGSHGATMGKRTGSIGCMRSEGKVVKGKKMPGHKGNNASVAKGLKVVKIEPEASIVVVKGSVPGKSGSLLFIQKA